MNDLRFTNKHQIRAGVIFTGANEVFVHVNKNNVIARQLYEKIGFQVLVIFNHIYG